MATVSGAEMVLEPVGSTRPESQVRIVLWEITSTPGIDVLVIVDPIDGEFSYVRTG